MDKAGMRPLLAEASNMGRGRSLSAAPLDAALNAELTHEARFADGRKRITSAVWEVDLRRFTGNCATATCRDSVSASAAIA